MMIVLPGAREELRGDEYIDTVGLVRKGKNIRFEGVEYIWSILGFVPQEPTSFAPVDSRCS